MNDSYSWSTMCVLLNGKLRENLTISLGCSCRLAVACKSLKSFRVYKVLEALTLMLLACNFIGKRSSGAHVFVGVLQKFWKQLFCSCFLFCIFYQLTRESLSVLWLENLGCFLLVFGPFFRWIMFSHCFTK